MRDEGLVKRRRVADCATTHDLNCRTELFKEGNTSKRGTAGAPGTKRPFLAWISLQLEECSQLTASSCSTFGTYHSNIQAEVIIFLVQHPPPDTVTEHGRATEPRYFYSVQNFSIRRVLLWSFPLG